MADNPDGIVLDQEAVDKMLAGIELVLASMRRELGLEARRPALELVDGEGRSSKRGAPRLTSVKRAD